MLWGISRDLWSLMSTIGCILYFYSLFKCKKILWADFITYNSNNQTFSGLFTFDQTFGWYLCVAQLQLSLIYAVSVLWVIIIFLTKFFSFSREKQDSSREKKMCLVRNEARGGNYNTVCHIKSHHATSITIQHYIKVKFGTARGKGVNIGINIF